MVATTTNIHVDTGTINIITLFAPYLSISSSSISLSWGDTSRTLGSPPWFLARPLPSVASSSWSNSSGLCSCKTTKNCWSPTYEKVQKLWASRTLRDTHKSCGNTTTFLLLPNFCTCFSRNMETVFYFLNSGRLCIERLGLVDILVVLVDSVCQSPDSQKKLLGKIFVEFNPT